MWPYRSIPSRVRGAPLGPGGVGQLLRNTSLAAQLLRAEHTLDGEHNALEVARGVGTLIHSGSYALDDRGLGSIDSHVATGHIRLLLDTARFNTSPYGVVLTNARNNLGKPVLIGHSFDGAGKLNLFCRRLESALGAANDWDAGVNEDIDVVVFNQPFTPAQQFLPLYLQPSAGSTLVPPEAYSAIRPVSRAQAQLFGAANAQHATGGAHDTIYVPRAWASAHYAGSSTYTFDASHGVSAVTFVSSGLVDVTMAEPFDVLQCAFARGASEKKLIINCKPTADDTYRLAIFVYDEGANAWDLGDDDFVFVFFGEK